MMLVHTLNDNDVHVEQQLQLPLFQLPAEIRNAIWTDALTAYVDDDDDNRKRSHPSLDLDQFESGSCFEVEKSKRISLSLLYSCRRVYLETAFLPASVNSVDFQCEGPWGEAALTIDNCLVSLR